MIWIVDYFLNRVPHHDQFHHGIRQQYTGSLALSITVIPFYKFIIIFWFDLDGIKFVPWVTWLNQFIIPNYKTKQINLYMKNMLVCLIDKISHIKITLWINFIFNINSSFITIILRWYHKSLSKNQLFVISRRKMISCSLCNSIVDEERS